MAGVNRPIQAFALAILFLISGPVSQFFMNDKPTYELDEDIDFSQSQSSATSINILGNGNSGVGPLLEMPADHALQTMTMKIDAGTSYRATGFDWEDWSEPGFTTTGLEIDTDGALILGFQGINWDFDSGAQGWTSTSNSYAQRTTSISCGMNGGSGGSWWTRGANVYVTSPTVNLAGYSGLSIQTWVKQGTYQCGEEPDTNENFYLQYKNSNNQWIQFHYLPGSTAGGSVTNVNYNLPADAFHSAFQVRARQNSGSGTCCDYWFFDDVIIPGISGANLTTKSFGWSGASDELIDKGNYPPVYLDAEIPDGAHLNWTVLDATTGNPIPGFENRTGDKIGLSTIDYETYKSLRLRLTFSSNLDGESPRLYAINGGGKIIETFNNDLSDSGWHGTNVSQNLDLESFNGTENSELISPVYDIDMPFTALRLQTLQSGNPSTYISLDYGNWVQYNSSNQLTKLDSPSSNLRIKYESTSTPWSVDTLDLQLYPSELIDSPYLDVDGDGREEWAVKQTGIGSWGNQDVFIDGNTSNTFQVGLAPTTWHHLVVPTNAKSFEVSVVDVGNVGYGVETLALWVGNTMIAQTGGTGYVPELRLSLNETELGDLNYETDSSAPAKIAAGQEFVHAKIEVISDAGKKMISGLHIHYDASQIVTSTATTELVMSINRARLDTNKASSMNLNFNADSKCTIFVEITDFTSSGDVEIGAMTWTNDTTRLIPSMDWREVNTRSQVHTSSPHRVIMNLYSDDYQAMWLIPVFSGTVTSFGDDDTLVISDFGMQHNATNSIHDLSFGFRTSQSFADQEELRIETRIELTNGVISKPAVKQWSNGAVVNDLIIEDMLITSDYGLIPSNNIYLKAEQNVTFHVEAGFDTPYETQKPFPGEYELSLTRNGEFIANTTHYEGNYWVVNTTTPFTSGNLTYEAKITPLAGGDHGTVTTVNRTFVVDPLAPVVASANIRYHDHLPTSSNREIIINITDQPVLPTNVTLMLWTEWSNDLDQDGWPSEGEYVPRLLTVPTDLDATYGSFVTIVDDTAAYPGEKVAGYVIGNDPAGHQLLGGGSPNIDEHLFMYQIMNDGSPLVDEDGFQWVDGRKAWLHPGQTYGLNVSFSEPNGYSDIHEISVELASNIPSDNLAIVYNSIAKDCYSESVHIEIVSCKVSDLMGESPNAFDKDLVLNLEVMPKWSMPDLGETRRQPQVKITDRAGNIDSELFPQNRWRFSAQMMIPNELSLWVENGVFKDGEARVSPGSSMELSGPVYFAHTMEPPQFDCQIEVKVDGSKFHSDAINGNFTVLVKAPTSSGLHALTWNVDCMPEQGIDQTSMTEAVIWTLVDGVGPEFVEFSSPRGDAILEPISYETRVIISENYGIDEDSVRMYWWVTSVENNHDIHSGDIQMNLVDEQNAGLRLEFVGQIDLSHISPSILSEQTMLKVRFEGRDLAGNQFKLSQNSENSPAHSWNLVKYEPDFSLERSGIDISKASLEVEEPVVVQIHVRNDGMLGGDVGVKVNVVDLNGQSQEIANGKLFVEGESVSTYIVDWKPSEPGMQRIEVEIESRTHKSSYIDVQPISEKAFLEDSIGATNPWILGTTMTMICVGMLCILAWMRFATAKSNEYEEEFEFDMFDDSDEY